MFYVQLLIILSVVFVLISTIIMIMSSLPKYKQSPDSGIWDSHPVITVFEATCLAWFTLEYIARVFAAHHRLKFVIAPLNIIDLIGVFPYYLDLALNLIGHSTHTTKTLSRIGPVFKILRILRILRVLKFARYSRGFTALGYTLVNTSHELGLLFMLLSTGVLLFASLAYFAEYDPNVVAFSTIVESCWWAIVTMTTVGYGDVAPKTTIGKLVGAMCVVSGVLFLALPIPIIANRFEEFYRDRHHFSKDITSDRYRHILRDPGLITRGLNSEKVPTFSKMLSRRPNTYKCCFKKATPDTDHSISDESLRDAIRIASVHGKPSYEA